MIKQLFQFKSLYFATNLYINHPKSNNYILIYPYACTYPSLVHQQLRTQ
jgi:hypothetical protein